MREEIKDYIAANLILAWVLANFLIPMGQPYFRDDGEFRICTLEAITYGAIDMHLLRDSLDKYLNFLKKGLPARSAGFEPFNLEMKKHGNNLHIYTSIFY